MTALLDSYERVRATKDGPVARDSALLIARVVLAWVFVYHGGATLFGWFGGPGAHKASAFFGEVAHLHPALFFTILAGSIELFGSLLALIGIFGRFAGLAMSGNMIIAMITVTAKNGISVTAAGAGGGYEYNLTLAALAAVIAILGTGRISLDYLIRERRSGS